MMAEEWPIAAEAADRPVDPARPRGPNRLATVRRDFFLDPDDRLSEQERALMTAMLGDIVAMLERELRVAAGDRTDTADPDTILGRLWRTRLLDRPGLVGTMLRRADEHRIAAAFSSHAGPRRLPLLPRLVSHDDPRVAAAAMALVVARGRRRDGFGQPRLELADLDAGDRSALTHSVAAAIGSGPADDQRWSAAAARVLERVDESESLDWIVASLVAAIAEAGLLDEEIIEAASTEGEAALVAAMIARISSIPTSAAWDLLVNAGEGGLALLAGMAKLPRRTAARLIADLGSTSGMTSVEEEIGRFDQLDPREAEAALLHWQLPRDYRAARTELGSDRG